MDLYLSGQKTVGHFGKNNGRRGALIDPARGHLRHPGHADFHSATIGQIDDMRLQLVGFLPFQVAVFLTEMCRAQFGAEDGISSLWLAVEAIVAEVLPENFLNRFSAKAVDVASEFHFEVPTDQFIQEQQLFAQFQTIAHLAVSLTLRGHLFQWCFRAHGFVDLESCIDGR